MCSLGVSDEYEDYYDYYDDKEWSDWSPCCNGNSKRRKLVTKDGELVNLTETLSCKKNECPGKWPFALKSNETKTKYAFLVDCVLSDWTYGAPFINKL